MRTIDEILADIGKSAVNNQPHWLNADDVQQLYGINASTFAPKTSKLPKASAVLSWLCGGFVWAGLLFGCAWFAIWAFEGLIKIIGRVF